MSKFKFVTTLASCVVMLSPIVAMATKSPSSNINPITSANSEAGIFFAETQSNYSENIVSPYGSDVENGMMPGFGVKLSDNFDLLGINNLYISFNYRHTSGQTQYEDGINYISAGHVTDNIGIKLGKTFFLNSAMAVTPYVFGGYRSWHRTVPGGVANPETYTNWNIGAGGKFQWAITRHMVLSANGGIGEQVGGNINANTQMLYEETNGMLFPSSLDTSLASRPYYTLGVGADYRVTNHLHLFANAQYTDLMYGGSSLHKYLGTGYYTGYYATLREPSSQTSNLGIDMGVAYSWN